MNQALIQSLFGTTTPPDVVFLNGAGEEPFAPAITAKLAAIPAGSSPNFYLVSVNEKYFNASLMIYFSNAKFTILGLEAVTKGALVKILKSLPPTVTKIGVANLKEIPVQYLQNFLNKIKKTQNIEVIVGDNVHLQSTDKEPPQKKRKLNSTNSVVATKLANQHKSNSSGSPLSGPAENIAKLLKERDLFESIINRDPEGRFILSLRARAVEAEEKVEGMSETIRQLQSQLRKANQRIQRIEESKHESEEEHLPELSLSLLSSPTPLKPPTVPEFTSGFMLHRQPDLLSAPPPSQGIFKFDSLASPYRQNPYGASYSLFSTPRPSFPTSLPLVSPQHGQGEHHLRLNAITQSGTGAVSETNSTDHPEQDLVHHFLR